MNSEMNRSLLTYHAGLVDTAVDIIYNEIDSLLRAGKFEEVDEIIQDWIAHCVIDIDQIDLELAILTVTLPAKSKLTHRAELFNDIKSLYQELELDKNPLERDLLYGLE